MRTIGFWLIIYRSIFSLIFSAMIISIHPVYSQVDTQILAIDWSPDGNWIVIGDNTGEIKILNADTAIVMKTLYGHTQEIMALSWNSDGTQIASGSPDGSVRIWDALTGQTIRIIQFSKPDAIFRAILDVDWSPNSALVVGALETGSIIIWDVLTGEISAAYSHAEWAMTVAWSPDGNHIASGGVDGKVLLWDITNESLSEFVPMTNGELGSVYSVAWSPDGSSIAIGSGRAMVEVGIQVFDFLNQEMLFEIPQASDRTISVHWSPLGTQIASGSIDGTIHFWDATTGDQLQVDEIGTPTVSITWSADGSQLAYADGDTVQIIPAPQLQIPTPPLK